MNVVTRRRKPSARYLQPRFCLSLINECVGFVRVKIPGIFFQQREDECDKHHIEGLFQIRIRIRILDE